MCQLGNTVINQIYEGSCKELGAKKPGPSSSRCVSCTLLFVFDWGFFADLLLLFVSCCCLFYLLARFQNFDYFICKCNIANFVIAFSTRQEKEAWIKSKYVEKRFLKKMSGSEALVEGERKSRPWTVKKCQRHSSSVWAPNKARRKYHRYEPGSASPANLPAG